MSMTQYVKVCGKTKPVKETSFLFKSTFNKSLEER